MCRCIVCTKNEGIKYVVRAYAYARVPYNTLRWGIRFPCAGKSGRLGRQTVACGPAERRCAVVLRQGCPDMPCDAVSVQPSPKNSQEIVRKAWQERNKGVYSPLKRQHAASVMPFPAGSACAI